MYLMTILTIVWSVLMSKQQKLSDQVESILSNRNRRFTFLMRKDRMEDALALGEEFFEWMDPTKSVQIEYFDEEELVDMYEEMKRMRLNKRKRRGRKDKDE